MHWTLLPLSTSRPGTLHTQRNSSRPPRWNTRLSGSSRTARRCSTTLPDTGHQSRSIRCKFGCRCPCRCARAVAAPLGSRRCAARTQTRATAKLRSRLQAHDRLARTLPASRWWCWSGRDPGRRPLKTRRQSTTCRTPGASPSTCSSSARRTPTCSAECGGRSCRRRQGRCSAAGAGDTRSRGRAHTPGTPLGTSPTRRPGSCCCRLCRPRSRHKPGA